MGSSQPIIRPRLATPSEFQAKQDLPLGEVFCKTCEDDRSFLQGLHQAATHVTLATKGAQRRLDVMANRTRSKTYWHHTRHQQRIEDAQWILDQINEAIPDGVYFGSSPGKGWGYWIDEEEM